MSISYEVEECSEEYLVAFKRYRANGTVENYNRMKKALEMLSSLKLVERALHGSTQASIELSKMNTMLHKARNKSELGKVHSIRSEDIDGILKQMDLTETCPLSTPDGDLTPDGVAKQYYKGKISRYDFERLMSTFEQTKKAKFMADVDSVINVNFSEHAKDMITDGKVE